jgi:predicted enzyme related to lactoylglutathione lyase
VALFQQNRACLAGLQKKEGFSMFQNSMVYSGFSVDDLKKAKDFYGDTLGLEVMDFGEMGLMLHFANGGQHFIYAKDNHQPATFTVLNFTVLNIDEAVAAMKERGIKFERYEITFKDSDAGGTIKIQPDEYGIMRSESPEHGPHIAWFKDPAGNILSVLQDVQ